MLCPRWDSNGIPVLENTGKWRKYAESGAVRRKNGPVRGGECGHCPHSPFFSDARIVLVAALSRMYSSQKLLSSLVLAVELDGLDDLGATGADGVPAAASVVALEVGLGSEAAACEQLEMIGAKAMTMLAITGLDQPDAFNASPPSISRMATFARRACWCHENAVLDFSLPATRAHLGTG